MLDILLQSYSLTPSLRLQNRLVMAPMTRCFAPNHNPTEKMAEYYGRRGSLGLIISEATMIDLDASGYPDTPGIFSKAQISGWQKVCDQVHQKGGRFFLQLWHAGMMSHPIYRRGKLPLSASDIVPKKQIIPRTEGVLQYPIPKAMDQQDIEEIISQFLNSALNALKAGCDGIELHAANGYLLDSFLHYYSNRRQDHYGGNPENMSRFLLEIVDVMINEIGREKIGIRLSPVPIPSMGNMEEDIRDQEVFAFLLSQLRKRGIAYIHTSSDDDTNDIGQLGMPVSVFLKKHFGEKIIGCGSYTLETGLKAISENQFDLLAFGRLLLANPYLIKMMQNSSNPRIEPFDGSMLQTLV
jgi:N-ethylmaleimide reductase